MAIKYSMEGFIKYLIINTVGNPKRGFTGLILRSVITIANDNLQDRDSYIAKAKYNINVLLKRMKIV